MRKRKTSLEIFSIAFLDCICCGLGAVLIMLLLYAVKTKDIYAEQKRYSETIGALSNKINGIEVRIADVAKELKLAQDKNEILGKIGGTVEKQLVLITALSNKLVQAQNTKTILGLPISEKKLVFLIDVSGSMDKDQRLADVKGAFKVVMASLDSTYSVDLLSFTTAPNDIITPHKKRLTSVTNYERRSAIDFVTGLQAHGGTPTSDAVKYAFTHYPDAEALVLLSDGEPNNKLGAKLGAKLDAATIINNSNRRNIPIYTVGVGSEMSKTNSTARKFMETVAKESGAKCITF